MPERTEEQTEKQTDEKTDHTTDQRSEKQTDKRPQGRGGPDRSDSAPKAAPPRGRQQSARSGGEAAREAARQLRDMTGSEIEAITGLRRTDEGWRVQVDVLELRRVPSTTDVVATYDVDVDADGGLLGYHRRHRFVRGEVDGR